jgi:N-acetylglucosaminyl-diphospho-decaprenol L-rhamnosyltransferase
MLCDVLTVTYGDCVGVLPLLKSLQAQSRHVGTVWIWHNGPNAFEPHLLAQYAELHIEVRENGENLGYGAGINRVFSCSSAAVVVVVNPDVALADDCIMQLAKSTTASSEAVLVGGLLFDRDKRVSSFALSLTHDCLGLNRDRGKPLSGFGPPNNERVETCTVSPSGALFAVNRAAWNSLGGGPLFVESFFLYLEDVALGLRVRRQGGKLKFCAQATGEHRFSDITGPRSALKLFHVERNRIWLQRALGGRSLALLSMPFTILRFTCYGFALFGLQKPAPGEAVPPNALVLGLTLLKAWKSGFASVLPLEIAAYLGPNGARVSLRPFMAPFREQLRDPTA